jgi:hypothetical protein
VRSVSQLVLRAAVLGGCPVSVSGTGGDAAKEADAPEEPAMDIVAWPDVVFPPDPEASVDVVGTIRMFAKRIAVRCKHAHST